MKQRSFEKEWIDLGPSYYSEQEYRDCLNQLGRIGSWLGGDRATFRAFASLPEAPTSILDIGCGGGLFTLRLAKRYPQATVVGMDISQMAIDCAEENRKKEGMVSPHVTFMVSPDPSLEGLSQQFDVVTATLVCHHLTDEELVTFLQQACRVAKRAVILNDLHRHPLASLSFRAVAPLFFRHRLIWHDGLLSIQRAFKREEWQRHLAAAGIASSRVKISWRWPFRWIVSIEQ